jgi:hypothetical protein
MNLNDFKRPTRTPEEIQEHKDLKLAEWVARKLEGLSEPTVPAYTGLTDADQARHRELEITIITDLGWRDPLADKLMRHHAREAVRTIQGYARAWEMNTEKGGPGGWNNLPKHTHMMIDSLRSRVDPVLYVAEAEFDHKRIIRSEYQKIESKYKNAVDAIELKNQKIRVFATSYTRSKIRQRERNEIQEVLDSMAVDIKNWQEDLCSVSDLI